MGRMGVQPILPVRVPIIICIIMSIDIMLNFVTVTLTETGMATSCVNRALEFKLLMLENPQTQRNLQYQAKNLRHGFSYTDYKNCTCSFFI